MQGTSVVKIAGLALALLMIVAGAMWSIPTGSDQPKSVLTAVGPILAGFGVALAYVALRSKR